MQMRIPVALLAVLLAAPACERRESEIDRTVTEPAAPTAPEAQPAPETPSAPETPTAPETQPVAGRTSLLVIQGEDGRTHPISEADTIRRVEEKLSSEGFDPGPVDGVADERLVSALRDFQKNNELVVSGTIDRRTSDALELDWKEISKSGKEMEQEKQKETEQMP